MANPAYPRWRDWRKCVGENGEKYIDANTDLVFEAGEFSRFKSARSFAAWLGLTPSEHSSGEIAAWSISESPNMAQQDEMLLTLI